MTRIACYAASTACLTSVETSSTWNTGSINAGIARFTLHTGQGVVDRGRVIVARRAAGEYGSNVTGW